VAHATSNAGEVVRVEFGRLALSPDVIRARSACATRQADYVRPTQPPAALHRDMAIWYGKAIALHSFILLLLYMHDSHLEGRDGEQAQWFGRRVGAGGTPRRWLSARPSYRSDGCRSG
jgi:hypothetical protein